MFKEPRNWWIKQIMNVMMSTLIPIIISWVYGLIKKVNWYSLIVKRHGVIFFVIFIIVWLILIYTTRRREKRLYASGGGESIFGTYEEHEGGSTKQ